MSEEESRGWMYPGTGQLWETRKIGYICVRKELFSLPFQESFSASIHRNGLPKDSKFVGIAIDPFDDGMIKIFFHSETFPQVDENVMAQKLDSPVYAVFDKALDSF